jgi:centromeric protein E
MGSPEHPGFIILAVHDVFSKISSSEDTEFLVRMSYIEIYNEQLKDLLQPDGRFYVLS